MAIHINIVQAKIRSADVESGSLQAIGELVVRKVLPMNVGGYCKEKNCNTKSVNLYFQASKYFLKKTGINNYFRTGKSLVFVCVDIYQWWNYSISFYKISGFFKQILLSIVSV
jgi:hypothetical protein